MSDEIVDPMAAFLPPEMVKHGLSFAFPTAGTDLVALVNKCWAIDALIKSATESKDSSVKVATHPFDVKASKDKQAAKVAADLLKTIVAMCDAAITKNRNVAWHLAETDSTLTTYLTSEVQYYRVKESPAKPATSGSKLDELRADRKALVNQAKFFLSTFPILESAEGLEKEGGKVKLPNLQGASGKGTSDSPTGRYARYKQTTWTVDGKTFPPGTDPRDLLRAIFPGIERVGKKVTDVFEPIDKARAKVKPGEVATVTINGKVVTYQETKSE